ncbi:MAG TPA: type II toxin-antitoxin system RelE/ParE family toxin [Casimicrobiaceae bacterium]
MIFLPAAREEATEAQDWYARSAPGLGARFRTGLDRTVRRIAANPAQFPVTVGDIRRALLHIFPYALFFRFVGDSVYVIACFHSSRDPKIWRGRVS